MTRTARIAHQSSAFIREISGESACENTTKYTEPTKGEREIGKGKAGNRTHREGRGERGEYGEGIGPAFSATSV